MHQTTRYRWLRKHKQLHDREINSFKYAGLWVVDPNAPLFLRQAYFVYNKLIISVLVVFICTVFADMCANVDELSIVTDDGCMFAGMCLVLFKAMNFQFRREKIVRLIDETLMCGEELCEASDVDVQELTDHYLLRSRVCFYGFSVLAVVLEVTLLSIAPEGSLPIRAKYPFDVSQSPYYHLAFTVEFLALTGGMVAIVSMDSQLITLCNDIIMTSEALNLNFENCRDLLDPNETKRKGEKDFVGSFKEYLRIHQRLISVLTEVNQIFSSGLLAQLLSSTFIICLTGFQAVVVTDQGSNALKFGMYLIAAVCQLLHICWVGNELIYSVDRCQWLSGWNNRPVNDVATLMILSTVFSRQPFLIKAGNFYPLSLNTFVSILRGSYSVFALLNNMHLGNDK